MAFLSSMNISASGMTAQKMRFDIIAENITNIDTTRVPEGDGPYRRKTVVMESIQGSSFRDKLNGAMSQNKPAGVRVSEVLVDETPFKPVYNPEHPDADPETGYVMLPNVDILKETADSMEATRAYEANLTVFNAVKMMASRALEIGR